MPNKRKCQYSNPIDVGDLYMDYNVMEDLLMSGGIAVPIGNDFEDHQPPCWDVWFLRLAYLVATKSKDPSTKIGSVIVKDEKRPILFGYNGLPVGVEDKPERMQRPEKYMYTEHSERNAIYCGAAFGIACKDTTLYTQGLPCCDCARGVIQARIKKVIIHLQYENIFRNTHIYTETWEKSQAVSKMMLTEAGVEIKVIDSYVGTIAYAGGKAYMV